MTEVTRLQGREAAYIKPGRASVAAGVGSASLIGNQHRRAVVGLLGLRSEGAQDGDDRSVSCQNSDCHHQQNCKGKNKSTQYTVQVRPAFCDFPQLGLVAPSRILNLPALTLAAISN